MSASNYLLMESPEQVITRDIIAKVSDLLEDNVKFIVIPVYCRLLLLLELNSTSTLYGLRKQNPLKFLKSYFQLIVQF